MIFELEGVDVAKIQIFENRLARALLGRELARVRLHGRAKKSFAIPEDSYETPQATMDISNYSYEKLVRATFKSFQMLHEMLAILASIR